MRADLQQADLVDRGDRAAAGADLDHVDHRRLDRQAGALGEAMHAPRLQHRRDLDAAVLDHAGLRGRAAHVEGDDILLAGQRAEQGGRESAAGGAAFEQADRKVARGLRRDEPAGRMHQAQVAPEAARREFAFQALQVAVHQRLHIGVGAGGDAALVFPDLGDDVARERDRQLRESPRRRCGRRRARARDCGRR